MTQTYIRFVVLKKDEDSAKRQGLFQAIRDLGDASSLLPHEEAAADQIRDWFNDNLEKPSTFSRSSRPHAKGIAISWFKDSAVEHIQKIYGLVYLLRAHGVHVEIIKTKRPGYIVYEDEHQITAEPFRDSGA